MVVGLTDSVVLTPSGQLLVGDRVNRGLVAGYDRPTYWAQECSADPGSFGGGLDVPVRRGTARMGC